jgi:hypothetical protein
LKHWRAFVFSAEGRKSKPPALQGVVEPRRSTRWLTIWDLDSETCHG